MQSTDARERANISSDTTENRVAVVLGVARSRTHEGAIATANEYCYRVLKLRNWSLHAHGY